MAAPPTTAAKPGRTLVAFLVVLLALGGIMFAVAHPPTPGLGLDLEGGTSITLTAATTDQSDVTPEALQTAVDIINSRVNGAGVAEANVATQGSNTIVVSVPGVGEDELVDLVGTTAELRFRQVCNIAAGTNPPPPTATPTPTVTPGTTPGATPGTTPGTTPSTTIAPSGTPSVVSTPSTGTTTPVAIGRFGTGLVDLSGLSFAATTTAATPEPSASTPAASTPAASTPAASTAPATPGATPSTAPTPVDPAQGCTVASSDAAAVQAFTELDCSDPQNLERIADTPNAPLASCKDDGSAKYLLAPATVLGTDVDDAQSALPQNGIGTAWQVNLTFTGDGSKKFTAMSRLLQPLPSPTNQFGIVLDGVVVSDPVMQGIITGNTAQITGSFTQAESQQLANVLKYGALPLAFTTSDVSEVTASLGSASLRAGLIAGLIGLGLVLVYAMLYYRALGIVVVASLAIAAVMTYIAVVLLSEWINFTLTLAGIAGLIVAIGITADSFIIYFERIRDEIREGRTLRVAVEHGWSRARRTIISADFISLLSAVVLYIVSIGNVRGFAFALGLSTVIDLLIVFFFTKPLMSWLASHRRFATGSRLAGVAGDNLGGSATRKRSTPSTRPTIAEES